MSAEPMKPAPPVMRSFIDSGILTMEDHGTRIPETPSASPLRKGGLERRARPRAQKAGAWKPRSGSQMRRPRCPSRSPGPAGAADLGNHGARRRIDSAPRPWLRQASAAGCPLNATAGPPGCLASSAVAAGRQAPGAAVHEGGPPLGARPKGGGDIRRTYAGVNDLKRDVIPSRRLHRGGARFIDNGVRGHCAVERQRLVA